jgi:hypothetical protein
LEFGLEKEAGPGKSFDYVELDEVQEGELHEDLEVGEGAATE